MLKKLRQMILASSVLASGNAIAFAAHAAPPTTDASIQQRMAFAPHGFELSVGAGYSMGWGEVESLEADMMSSFRFHFDVALPLSQKLAVGFLFSQSELGVDHLGGGRYAPSQDRDNDTKIEPVHRAGCLTCTGLKEGGRTIAAALVTRVIGPSIDYSPWGRSGPFGSLAAGVGSVDLTEPERGAGFLARLGYRYVMLDRLSLTMGLGMQGVAAKDVQVWQPLAFVEGRVHIF